IGEPCARSEVLVRGGNAPGLRIVRVDQLGLLVASSFVTEAQVHSQLRDQAVLVLHVQAVVADPDAQRGIPEPLREGVPAFPAAGIAAEVLRESGDSGVAVVAVSTAQQALVVRGIDEVPAELEGMLAPGPGKVIGKLEALLRGV